jgi:hypothetical protein
VNDHDVNLDAAAAKIEELLQQLAALKAEIDAGRAARDFFAMHIYKARAAFHRASESSKGKSTRHEDWEAESSYRTACEFGFRGGLNAWRAILCPIRGKRREPLGR